MIDMDTSWAHDFFIAIEKGKERLKHLMITVEYLGGRKPLCGEGYEEYESYASGLFSMVDDIKEYESIFDYCVNLAELGGYRKPYIGESYQDYSDYVKSIHYGVVGVIPIEHIES